MLLERERQPRDLDLPFKLYANTVCVAPDHATRPGHMISVDDEIKRFRDRPPYLQVRARLRNIVNNALGGIAVVPACKTAPQNPPSWRNSTVWSCSAVVDDVDRRSGYCACKRRHAILVAKKKHPAGCPRVLSIRLIHMLPLRTAENIEDR